MASKCQGKTSWPELIGADGVAAATKIRNENRGVFALILPEGSPLPPDFECQRVIVIVNYRNKVVKVPRAG